MNKLIRLSPTGIEYGDYAWNFASGCGNNLDGKCKAGGFRCWAYSISQRFEGHYPNGFKPTIYPESLCSPVHLKKPSRILCAFMGDLFWDCPEFNPDRIIDVKTDIGFVDHDTLKGWVFNAIKYCPQHTFLFLTKQPQNLIKFSPFPPDCYVGVTVTRPEFLLPALDAFDSIQCSVRYLSIEPMLARFDVPDLSLLLAGGSVYWVIIGAVTGTRQELLSLKVSADLTLIPYDKKWTLQPPIEWVEEIVRACDKAGVKVFLKNNLKPALPFDKAEWAWARERYFEGRATNVVYTGLLRQEIPDG